VDPRRGPRLIDGELQEVAYSPEEIARRERQEQILREAKSRSRDRIIQEARAEKARLRVELWALARQHARGPTHEEIMRMKPKELRASIEGFGEESYLRWLGSAKVGQTDNLLPGKISGRAGRERMRKLFHMALLVFLACGVGWFSNRMIQRGTLVEKTRKLAEERMGRTGEVDLAIRQQSRFRQQKETARIVEEETVVPMAELLFRDTAACLPPELRLTRFLVELDEEKSKGGQAVATYSIRMEGEITRPNAEVKPAVEKLCEALAKSPWKIQVMKRTGQSDKDPEVPAELKLPGRFYVFAAKRE
jgi:hypothetical protein